MQLCAIAHVTDMERSVAFYELLGLSRGTDVIDDHWNEFHLGDAILALHVVDPNELSPPSDHLALNLNVSPGELERLYSLCDERGYTTGGPIQDVGFGRFFWVTDPDNLPVQFNERAH